MADLAYYQRLDQGGSEPLNLADPGLKRWNITEAAWRRVIQYDEYFLNSRPSDLYEICLTSDGLVWIEHWEVFNEELGGIEVHWKQIEPAQAADEVADRPRLTP